MAARTRRPGHNDSCREKIQTSQLINRLQDHVFKENVELSPSQLKAIEILLKKSLPDVSSIEMTGADGKDLIPESVKIELVKPNAASDT